jgi:hypothetical protein
VFSHESAATWPNWELKVGTSSTLSLTLQFILSLDPLCLADMRALYPKFEGLFQKHVKDARLDGISKKSPEFKTLKLDVMSLWALQEKHDPLHPATRSALIQALLVEHNVQLALQLLESAEVNNNGSGMVTRFVSYWSGSRGEEYFKNQMKTAAAKNPDSHFLKQLDMIEEKDLRPTVQNAKALAHKELSRSIDTVVNNMTHAVLAMQQDHCKMAVQAEVDNEERNVLDDARVEFIREINKRLQGNEIRELTHLFKA